MLTVHVFIVFCVSSVVAAWRTSNCFDQNHEGRQETFSVIPENGSLEEYDYGWNNAVSGECMLAMAESSIGEANAGWGVFTLRPLKRGQTVGQGDNGDAVIHFPDPNPLAAEGMKRLIWEYLWDGQEVGGQYEGQRVMSFAPGIGMLGNGDPNFFNVLPQKPNKDDAGVGRFTSPGAGAFTHYSNLTWNVQKDLDAGSEIFVNYGEGWFKERGYENQSYPTGKNSISWLRKHGYCLDNLLPGKSGIPHAGRGAFAARELKNGDVIAPVPVLPVTEASLKMAKEYETTGEVIVTDQLVRNYCFGHQNSSLLLYPYAPMVNLINHGRNESANVRLQWSPSSVLLFENPVDELQQTSTRLLLELVATRPIQKGEEILLDYGNDWEAAWRAHVGQWKPPLDQERYVSSRAMNEDPAQGTLRTAAEMQTNPYPANIFTSCYYKLSADLDINDPNNPTQVFHWRRIPGLVEEPRYLRPCALIDRRPASGGGLLYTARIFNRPGLAPAERLPKGRPHIVAGIPRYAIEFSDKLYTTDQHLSTAFRKEIGLEIFPRQWMDLK